MGGKTVENMVNNTSGTPRKVTLGHQHQESQGEEGPTELRWIYGWCLSSA